MCFVVVIVDVDVVVVVVVVVLLSFIFVLDCYHLWTSWHVYIYMLYGITHWRTNLWLLSSSKLNKERRKVVYPIFVIQCTWLFISRHPFSFTLKTVLIPFSRRYLAFLIIITQVFSSVCDTLVRLCSSFSGRQSPGYFTLFVTRIRSSVCSTLTVFTFSLLSINIRLWSLLYSSCLCY